MTFPVSRTLLSAALLLVLAACSSTPSTPLNQAAAPVQTRAAAPAVAAAPGVAGTAGAVTPQSRVATVDLSAPGAAGAASPGTAAAAPAAATTTRAATAVGGAALLAAPSQRVVYFDFDSYTIRDDAKPVLEGHAKALAASTNRRMSIEGHTDERGGREYNLALGQKRAEAVLRSLSLLGVPERQLEAVSFGKERPVATGSDEDAWARNRRAELKDR